MPPELADQVTNVFKQIKLCVEAAGGSVDDIIKVNFWMKDPATGRKALNGEWSKMFPDPDSRPARHTLALGANNPNHVTCDFTAVIGANVMSSRDAAWRPRRRLTPGILRSVTAAPTKICGCDGGFTPMRRSRLSTQARVGRCQLAPGRGAVELLQQALVVVGVLIAGAAAEAHARRPPPRSARRGWAGAWRA